MIWKDIRGTNYQVSMVGQIKNTATGKILRGSKNRKGYLLVEIGSKAKGGLRIYKTVHTIVAENFIGKRPSPKHQINHRNGNKSDNSAWNLEYVTCKENVHHCHRKHLNKNRLNPSIVLSIYRQRKANRSKREIASSFGVSLDTVQAIHSGRRWSCVTGHGSRHTVTI